MSESNPSLTVKSVPFVNLVMLHEISSVKPYTYVHEETTLTGSLIKKSDGINTTILDPYSITLPTGVCPVISIGLLV